MSLFLCISWILQLNSSGWHESSLYTCIKLNYTCMYTYTVFWKHGATWATEVLLLTNRTSRVGVTRQTQVALIYILSIHYDTSIHVLTKGFLYTDSHWLASSKYSSTSCVLYSCNTNTRLLITLIKYVVLE